MDHFNNPRNVGEMDSPDGIGHVGNPVCGDIMEIYIKVKGILSLMLSSRLSVAEQRLQPVQW
jgi:hypothetical protein